MPYQAITDMDPVDAALSKMIAAKDFDAVMEIVDYWHRQAEQFKLRYLLKEEQHIKDHLHDVWQLTKAKDYSVTPDQQVYVDFIEEEYSYLK